MYVSHNNDSRIGVSVVIWAAEETKNSSSVFSWCDTPGARKKTMRDLNSYPQCIVLRSVRAHVWKGGHKLQAVLMQIAVMRLLRACLLQVRPQVFCFFCTGLCANDWLLAHSRAHARPSPCDGASSIFYASASSPVHTCVHVHMQCSTRVWQRECACATTPPSRDNHHGSCPQ